MTFLENNEIKRSNDKYVKKYLKNISKTISDSISNMSLYLEMYDEIKFVTFKIAFLQKFKKCGHLRRKHLIEILFLEQFPLVFCQNSIL